MDLSSLTDADLSVLRQGAALEQDRRRKLAQLPDDIAAMARDAVATGCDLDTIRERVDDALTPEQVAALEA